MTVMSAATLLGVGQAIDACYAGPKIPVASFADCCTAAKSCTVTVSSTYNYGGGTLPDSLSFNIAAYLNCIAGSGSPCQFRAAWGFYNWTAGTPWHSGTQYYTQDCGTSSSVGPDKIDTLYLTNGTCEYRYSSSLYYVTGCDISQNRGTVFRAADFGSFTQTYEGP